MKKPRILFYDVENSANEIYAWGPRQYDLSAIKVKKHYQLLSYAYQWEGDRKIHCVTREGQKTDLQLVTSLGKLLNEADFVVSHNGVDSDHKKTRTRMIFHRVPPLRKLMDVDTLKEVRKNFAFNGNSLGAVAEFLSIGSKLKHPGFDMWTDCDEKDDAKAWRFMARYNKHDVRLLRAAYKVIRPWIQNHPNVHRISSPGTQELGVCPTCGSRNVHKLGFASSTSGRVTPARDWRCNEKTCGRRFTTNLLPAELKALRARLSLAVKRAK